MEVSCALGITSRLCELLQSINSRNAFDLRPVNAAVSVLRMKQSLIEFRFIAEQQQTFRIRIQPANGVNIFRETKLRERAVWLSRPA